MADGLPHVNHEHDENHSSLSKTYSAGRVVRGGSWIGQAGFCRAAIRNRFDPGSRWIIQGLRLSEGQEPAAAEPQGAERQDRKGGSRG